MSNSCLLTGSESIIYCCDILLQWDEEEVGGALEVSAVSKSDWLMVQSPPHWLHCASGSTELEGVVESY